MGAIYTQLSMQERRRIKDWWHAKVPVAELARVLKRHKSTIFREIKRNFWADDAFPKKYAGDITRSGSNAELQLVDERIVGHKPKTLTHAEAAAMPLTTITAYEAFFDRLGIDRNGADNGQLILIIGTGGGVGSIGVQLAIAAGLMVIATASCSETTAWGQELEADPVGARPQN